MVKYDYPEIIYLAGQIFAYVLGLVLIVQIIRAIFGGTWQIEEIILALVIFNLTITFGIGGYLISMNNKISRLDSKLEGHFGWHKGKETKLNNV